MEHQWVPNGFILIIVMEKVTGESLETFRGRPSKQQGKIRGAFRHSLKELYSFGIEPRHTRLQNLIYDPKKNRCYIIDYEDVNFLQLANPLRRAREEFCKWSLTGRDRQK
ncbi:hypothetical protein D8B26_004462 [Coccidioides posadasii str. Silveira]|uniref:Uncharacterized protein n=1 Tax=Coccidioides posadasii (strain RMSCC 757 / Silveira) TaxID=443226 RepID=E9DEZ6_COCPS|nr:conserved hypothetical protein [Coccidioides posadasii str. Silveira]QVM09802.1 hypothetical protein D8B26_004462 [Coccidioides posadasii str. Silveira]